MISELIQLVLKPLYLDSDTFLNSRINETIMDEQVRGDKSTLLQKPECGSLECPGRVLHDRQPSRVAVCAGRGTFARAKGADTTSCGETAWEERKRKKEVVATVTATILAQGSTTRFFAVQSFP